jgi:hypothetical protein
MKKKPYTVIFYIDGDYSVETFVQHVMANDAGHAFDVAVWQAKRDGGTSSGRTLPEWEYDNATEIATFDGHLQDAFVLARTRRKSMWSRLFRPLTPE